MELPRPRRRLPHWRRIAAQVDGDRLRFPAPVPAGSRIHARTRVKSVEKLPKGMQMTLEIVTQVVGNERPSVINDLVILYM